MFRFTNGAFLVEFLVVAFIVLGGVLSLTVLALVQVTHPGAQSTPIVETLQNIVTAGFGALVALAYAAKGKRNGE